eukprot:4896452-Amphidinium_carterae.1
MALHSSDARGPTRDSETGGPETMQFIQNRAQAGDLVATTETRIKNKYTVHVEDQKQIKQLEDTSVDICFEHA